MGKITPRVKAILVFVTFLGFTNFILSETRVNFSEIIFTKIFSEKAPAMLSPAGRIPVEKTVAQRAAIKSISTVTTTGIKSSLTYSVNPAITNIVVTHASCSENEDGAIEITVSGGTSPYTYVWSSGHTTQNVSKLPTGNYTVTVTDSEDVSTTSNVIEIKVEDAIAPIAKAKDIILQLNSAGAGSITPDDINNGSSDACGIASLTINKDTFDCSNVGANTVTLTVTDNNGNTDIATATVTVEDKVAPVVNTKNITVQLDANGLVSIADDAVNNGSTDSCGGLTFSTSNTSFDCSNVGNNTVTLTVTDENGNTGSAEAIVKVEDKVAPVVNTKNITVQLDANGLASIADDTVNNGSTDSCGALTFSTNKTSFDCSNVGVNTVTLTVTDDNGNTSTGQATVNVEDNVAPVVNTKNITVQLDANGTASITQDAVNDGSSDSCGGLTFSTDKTSFDCSNVGANTVTLTVTDKNGNPASKTAVVTVEDNIIPVIAAAADINANTDAGVCAAQINITPPVVSDNCTVAAPTGTRSDNKSFSDPFPTGETIITWTAIDANGNEAIPVTQRVMVKDNEAPVLPNLENITWGCTYTLEVPVAMDNCDNEITATGNRSTTFTSSGEITWTFKDAAGNSSTIKQVITINPVSVSIQKQDIVCFDAANGVAEAKVTGGVGPFTYNWGSAGNTAKVENLTPGDYSVTVTDTNGCTISAQVTITQPAQLNAAFTSTSVTCSGNNDGTISITNPTGGFGNYEYSINGTNWQQSGTFSNLNGGNYSVQIRDAQNPGCIVILESNLVLDEPQELQMTEATSTATTCFGASDGTATAGTVAGGNGEYQYSIDNTNFSSSKTFTGLPAGTHTIFVKDSKGCSFQKTVTVTQPAVLNGTVARTDVSCFEGNDGKITITNPTGGSGTFEFSVNGTNWQTSGNFTNLIKGSYNVQIRDKASPACLITLKENYAITQPAAPITIEVTTVRTSIYGTATGSATANPTGGSPGYTYEWRKKGNSTILQTTKTATSLAAGFYNLTVIDSKGCKLQQEVEIIDAIEAFILTRSTCEIEEDIDAIRTFHYIVEDGTALGGVAPYTYTWDFGADAINRTRSGIGEFRVEYSTIGNKTITLTVKDSTGETYTTTQEQYIGKCYNPCGKSSNIEFDPNNIYIGYSNGTRMLTTSSDYCDTNVSKFIFIQVDKSANIYNPYIELSYIISNDITEVTNQYYVNGCRSGNDIDENPSVNQPNRVGGFIKLTLDPIIFSCGDNLNIDTFYATWTNVSKKECGQNNNKFCFSTNEPVFVPTELRAEATPTPVLCKGESTGTITVKASGGFAPYSYKLTESSISQSQNLFVNLPAGAYTVYVEDAAGKKTTTTATVLEPNTAITATTVVQNPICFGETGEATVTATGGTPFTGDTYEYLWNDANQQTTATATGLLAGNYTVTVIDTNGCQLLKEVTITEPEQLSVASAGEDQIFKCGNNSTFLNANTPVTGVGTWTIESGTGGTITDTTDPKSEFTGGADTYLLSWTIAHEDGTCSTTDQVEITFVDDCSTLDFDGLDDHVILGNNYGLSSGTFSLEAWIKLKSTNGVKTVLSKKNMRNPGDGGFDLVINQGAPTFRWGNSAVSSSSQLGTQRWYHIAVIFKDSRAHLYVDGIRVGNAAATNPATTSYPFLIGGAYDINNPEIPQNYFHGWIEEVRIWNTALTEEQLRFMMNQRLEVGVTPVKGTVLPLNVPGNLSWTSLGGYYQLLVNEANNGITIDKAANKVDGQLKNITTPQENTAPLPYVSVAGGPWREKTIWAQPVVWDVPNAKGINNENINWNIAKINHDITSGGHDTNVLGLLSEGGTLTISNPNEAQDWENTGQALRVSHYLKLNGNINLVGESQLIQSDIKTASQIKDPTVEFPQSITSVLEESSTGYIERAQQGTANSYNYNYWSSPVSLQGSANNSTYTIGSVMLDGSSTSNYGKSLSFHNWHEYADGALGTPRKISNYWLFKFRGTANVYSEWKHVGSTGTLNAGEGYTMKGTSGNAAISDRQNYVFKGKPNNGTIKLNVGKDQNYLLGNPYPSALDVNEFILDNLKDVTGGRNSGNVFNGAVYFWDHFAGKSHILKEYIGGYATRNLLDGVPAVSNDERIDANDEKSNKIPGQFVPVAQGFFINTSLDPETSNNISVNGGDVIFRNFQRTFVRETNAANSLFLRPENITKGDENKDSRQKIRLDFKSPMGYNRQILVGVDNNTTNGFDLGYDAPLNDNNLEDMFWIIENNRFVIQGVPDFNLEQVLKLGVKINKKTQFSIKINKLENIDEDLNIYLRDNVEKTYHDLRKKEFRFMMEPGTFNDRFEIVFQIVSEIAGPPVTEEEEEEPETEEEEEEEEEEQGTTPGSTKPDPTNPEKEILTGDPQVYYMDNSRELVVNNPEQQHITKITLHSLSGQLIEEYTNVGTQKEIKLPVRSYSSSVYVVKMFTEKGIIFKKMIINN